MPELSPAAQKILRADAAVRCLAEWSSVNDPPCHPSDKGWSGCGTCANRAAVAATLEATADQADPERHVEDISYQHQNYVDGWKDCLEVIRNIVAELNGDSNV